MECLFCKIIAGEIPAAKLYEDEDCVIIRDIEPQAPTHVLVLPRTHLDSLDKASPADERLLGRLLLEAANFARREGLADAGYRVVVNTNADGGQTVFHLHIHLLAGRPFVFPPG
ncbi:MAG TPA: histidine triad nucleotide-binding protein [Pyrinomonadaceae bacterium]|nr:histidine triad nucleotide-binding protein [Pyrinomonadaceae bacterium]